MYTHIWQKYLPAIRILLKRAANADQKIGLNKTDFEKGSRSGKPSCTFSVLVENGRLNNSNPPSVARELVTLLISDEHSKNLLRENIYKISLNAEMHLRIVNISATRNAQLPEQVGHPS